MIFMNQLRLGWAGHVARMGEKELPRIALDNVGQGRRPHGRPRQRWLDNIRVLAGRHWRDDAQDRVRWRRRIADIEEAWSRRPTRAPQS